MPVAEEVKQELTTQEAMDYLHVSRNTFYKWLREGKLVPSNLNPMLDRQTQSDLPKVGSRCVCDRTEV